MRIPVKHNSLLYRTYPGLTPTERVIGISVDEDKLNKFLAEAKTAVPHLSTDEQFVWAVYNASNHPGHLHPKQPRPVNITSRPADHPIKWNLVLDIIIIIILLLLIFNIRLHAAPDPPADINIAGDNFISSARLSSFPQLGSSGIVNNILKIGGVLPTFTGSSLNINCTGGCGAAASFLDNSAFTVGTTPINVIGGYFTSGADPSCTTGNACRLRADASSNLRVNCVVGCAGGSTTPADAFANPSTAGLQFDLLAGYNGTTWDRLRSTIANGLQVDVTRVQGTVSSTQSGNWTSRIVGNIGGILDVIGQNATAPANWLGVGCVFFTSPTALTTGNGTYLNCDTSSNLFTRMNSWLGSTAPTVGSKTSANSIPVVIASDQAAFPVTLTSTTVTGTVTVAGAKTNNNAAPGATNVGVLGVLANAANPTWTEGDLVTLSADLSGNNRTLINSWFGSSAPTVGSKTSANSIPVVIASDQAAVPVTLTSTTVTGTVTVAGNKTNNNAAPGATNIGALPAIANAATQTWTEGDLVAESVDLSGRQRVVGITGDNGGAAASNRVPILPAIAQTSYRNGTADTQGRDASLDVGTDGLLWTAQLPAIRPASYHWSASFVGTSTTIAAHIAGNASDTLLVTKITFSCTQTTAGILTVTVNKTSAASTGGTAATITAVPDDSTYGAAASVAQSFTGTGPTVGTLVGQIDAAKVGCNATTGLNDDIYILNLRQKPVVLRGVVQTLEIGVGAATTGGNYTVTFEGIETATITP